MRLSKRWDGVYMLVLKRGRVTFGSKEMGAVYLLHIREIVPVLQNCLLLIIYFQILPALKLTTRCQKQSS